MANTPNPGGQQQAAPPPPPAPLLVDVKIIDQHYLADKYQATFEVTLTRGGTGVPNQAVRLSEKGITLQSGLTGAFGTYILMYEAPLAPTPTTHLISISAAGLNWSATISLAAMEKPDVVSEDPERVVVNGFILDDSGLLNVDIRVVKGKGYASTETPVMVVFPDLKLQYERTTDQYGHCKFECPHLIEPGEESLVIVSVSGIEKACEIRVINHVRPVALSPQQITAMARRRPTYWIFGIPAWLLPASILMFVAKFFSVTAKQSHMAKQESNDFLWIIPLIIGVVAATVFALDQWIFRGRISVGTYYRQRRYRNSRRVKATSRDPWMEHFKETIDHVFRKKDHGPTVTVHTPLASNGGTPAPAAEHGISLMTAVVIEFFSKGLWEGIEAAVRKFKK